MPEALRDAAEQVRLHLVSLRGGAPFLSPKDASLLLEWLDAGTSVAAILTALERAAERRRAGRSRVPLALTHARPHLAKVQVIGASRSAPATDAPHPFETLVRGLQGRARQHARGAQLQLLAAELLLLDDSDPQRLVEEALAHVRDYFDQSWLGLPPQERERRCEECRDALRGRVTEHEVTLEQLAEEQARAALRAEYPELSAPSLWDLVHQ